MAEVILENGYRYHISPKNGNDFSLQELKKIVDGYIEVVNLHNGDIMVINEEGKFYKDYNHLATEIAKENYAIGYNDWICGDVLICKNTEVL